MSVCVTPTYETLTLEFISCSSYDTRSLSNGDVEVVRFMMFNREYQFRQNKISNMMHFQSQPSIPYEVSMVGRWNHEFGHLWEWLTEDFSFHMEGKKSSHIYNTAISYFQKVNTHTFFGRDDSTGSVNMKEMFFIDCVFKPCQLHSNMLDHMKMVSKSKNGCIIIERLITSIIIALGLHIELTTLQPLEGSNAL